MSKPTTRGGGAFRRTGLIALGFVVAPSAFILSVGILVLVFGRQVHERVFGVLILSFAAVLVAGVVATIAYVRRQNAVARLQTEFVARVSHDLRTPLTSIRMFVETLQLRRAADAEAERQCLDTIATETERLTALIERLLDWGRLEAGKRTFEPQRRRVEDVVDGALVAFEPQLLAEPAEVRREIPPGLPAIDVDFGAVTEALLNLLQNAHRYSGADKRITVRCAARGAFVEISVEDNGPGIPPREQHRVFEKFYRAADALRRNIPGSGLGLAMVKSIVEAHGGTVTVRNRAPQGSEFIVALPAAVAS